MESFVLLHVHVLVQLDQAFTYFTSLCFLYGVIAQLPVIEYLGSESLTVHASYH